MVKGRLQDPNVATTLLPSFTTTTPHDQATAAIALLGTMKEYFSYGINYGCSFPSVTLLGERSDWADITYLHNEWASITSGPLFLDLHHFV